MLLLVTLAGVTLAQDGAKAPETLPALADSRVSDAVRKTLEPKGFRVATPDGPVDVWLRAAVPMGKNPEAGTVYGGLTESALVGVIQFAKDSHDYKGLHIPAGIYTMRYEVQPNDGNHLGTAPTRDFLLLMPASADANPAATYNFDQMVQMSSQVNGTNKHPTPLNLVTPESKTYPSVTTDSEEHTILNVQLNSGSSAMPLALVVHGTAAQ